MSGEVEIVKTEEFPDFRDVGNIYPFCKLVEMYLILPLPNFTVQLFN